MVDSWDIDLEPLARRARDDEPVGVAKLGVRGDRGWIGGSASSPASGAAASAAR